MPAQKQTLKSAQILDKFTSGFRLFDPDDDVTHIAPLKNGQNGN